ncbi:MAG: hypothetical protein CME62_08095 [Halobacteriovoraceae bacterium]|nr:hypothetical protein [Halobacteriovoraceae bacterium]|tara:strand:+ start:10772 stop:11578 length:807 start_codon:yes stop_codon:yes gene_type:complete
MKYFLLTLIITNTTFAFDWKEKLEELKSKAIDKYEELKGDKNKKPDPYPTKIKMPELPQISKSATSLSVYEKKGAIYSQGASFKNLSTEKKRPYRTVFIQELYEAVYEADISKQNVVSLLNVLEKGGSREGVYRSLVLSNDYGALEAYNTTPNEKLINYVVQFGEKYLGRKFSPDQLQKINLYGIKRVICEKILELIDSFPVDGKDLKSWYALVSAEYAQKFPRLWKSKIRKSPYADLHYKWASTVPLQHIKSELIIKTHKIYNSIQR